MIVQGNRIIFVMLGGFAQGLKISGKAIEAEENP